MFQTGQQIGTYTLINRIGRGGFGEVWLAEKRSQFITKKVAVKLPLDEQVNPDAIRQEAELWEQASGHPNVLPIIDAEVYDGQVVIVSEYAEGGSLADKLQREGKLSISQAVEMTVMILNGLEYLHNKHIIHRDIKPANILLQGNMPRLADFGISRAMQATAASSAIIGTDSYMSPEAFDGKRTIQTDIWSVGVVLYELLKGSLPFPQAHMSEKLFAVLTKDFEPLPSDIPQNLQQIIQKALAKSAQDRYQNTDEMRGDLKNFLSAYKPAPESSINTKPISNTETPLPETRAAGFSTTPPVHLSSHVTNTESSKKSKKLGLYIGLAAVAFLFLSTLSFIGISKAIRNSYDIPAVKGTAKELKFFESGSVPLSKEQRTYDTTFYRNSTRYIYYELELDFPPPGDKTYFTLENVWYKDDNVISRDFFDSSAEGNATSTIISGGYGRQSYGSFGEGNYRLEIKCNDKVIASKNFEMKFTLAGKWNGGPNWGDIKISGSGNSYTGGFSYFNGTFSLTKTANGTYQGTWKYPDNSQWGTIEQATISADGNKITMTWSISYPESESHRSGTSTWERKN